MTTTTWTHPPACASRLELPWLTDVADVTPEQVDAMRAVCHACPALFECLAAVDDLDVTGGWWAGADRDPHAAPVPAPEWADAPGQVWVPMVVPGYLIEQAAFDVTVLGTADKVA